MHGTIPAPSRGEYPRASWAAGVTEVCNDMVLAGFDGSLAREGAGAFGHAPLPSNGRVRNQVLPHPFEVRWRADAGEDGGYAIFLPNSHLVQVDGAYLSPSGVTAITDAPGWMSIDDATVSSTHVWLLVSESNGSTVATISCTSGTAARAVCIAEMSAPSGCLRPTITQSVVGALTLCLGQSVPDGYALTDITVVADVNYDTYNHKMTKTTRTVKALVPTNGTTSQADVFVAVPHQS